MTKVVKCPKCVLESSEAPAQIPLGKIKTKPFKDNKPLFKNEGDIQTELF